MNFLKRNLPASVIVSLLLCIVLGLLPLWIKGETPNLANWISLGSIFAIGILVLSADNVFNLLQERDFHILFFYVCLCLCLSPINNDISISTALFLTALAWFCVLYSAKQRYSRSAPFLAACFLTAAAIFHPPVAWFAPSLLFGLLRFRDLSMKDFLAFLTGIAISIGYFFFFRWFSGLTIAPWPEVFADKLFSTSLHLMPTSLSLLIVELVLAFIVIRSLLRHDSEGGNTTMVARYYEFLVAFLINSLAISSFFSIPAKVFTPIIVIPVTCCVLSYFQTGRGNRYKVAGVILLALLVVNYLDLL